MRSVPIGTPCRSKTAPKASAEAMPEQKTKISVASEKPKRAGIHNVHGLPGVCASRMMNIARPRKKSSRGSRGLPAVFGVSGYSGAGTTPSRKNDPAVLAENLLPYSLADHVHEREVSHHLGRDIRFLPHVAPFFRGISLTVAIELGRTATADELLARYRDFYSGCPLVEVAADAPEVRDVRGRHQVAIGGFTVSARQPSRIAVVAALDNLLKGAATQAVQNLNLAFGLEPLAGLDPTLGSTP